MNKTRLQRLAGIVAPMAHSRSRGINRATALNENFEEEAQNLISRQAGTIMTMRQDSDKTSLNMLDQALENLIADQVGAGYSDDAIHGFFTSLVRDAIELEKYKDEEV